MFFWTEIYETPLSEAIIEDDIETINRLCGRKDHVFAKNSLGFNALEIASFLGKEDYVQILNPQPKKLIKVIFRQEGKLREIDAVEFEKLFHVRYLSHLKFGNYKLFKKVINNCPAIFRNSRNEEALGERQNDDGAETPETCAFRAVQYRREILEGYFADVTIQWIDDILGYGVFTNRDLKAGDYVGEHVGEVRRISRFHPQLNAYCMRYPSRKWPFPYYVVDARLQGNEIRFVNHSFEPNLEPKLAVDHGLLHQLFFACRDTPKGSQLTWNYGEDYWISRGLPVEPGSVT